VHALDKTGGFHQSGIGCRVTLCDNDHVDWILKVCIIR